MNNLESWSPRILKTPPELHVFLFSIHDWIAHLVGMPYCWGQYGTSLKEILCEKLSSMDELVQTWIFQTIDAPISQRSLLYKHNVFRAVADEEIFTHLDYTPLYALMATMLSKDVVFMPLGSSGLWNDLTNDFQCVNVLRVRRPFIKQFAHQLAMRDDVTVHHLSRDYGAISALSLLYGLCLTCVILIHETRIRSSPDLNKILESLFHALISLQGVLDNVESQWLSPHLR